MTSLCVYTMPIVGDVLLKQPLKFQIDDLILQFFTQDDVLTTLLLVCPFTESEDGMVTNIGSAQIFEPRANEVEEIVLQIGSGFALFSSSNVEILYENRCIQIIEGLKINNLEVGIFDRTYKHKSGFTLETPMFIRSVITGCIIKKHDPSLTFFNRGTLDANSSRFIEAFYNFFFFLEYLFGNGKSGSRQTIEEFLKSSLLTNTLEKVKKGNQLSELVSLEFLEQIRLQDTEENLKLIVKTRGHLHHPNRKRPDNWDPRKQRHYANVTIFLQVICLHISHHIFFNSSATPKIERAYKKAQRCLRKNEDIVIITK